MRQTRSFAKCSVLLSSRKYTDKHEWVGVSGDKATVGITHYAQDSLGDIVYAQLPQLGDELSQGDECGALESVKAASELYCPVSGVVSATNPDVEETPGLVNQSCYDKGWLFEVELKEPAEVEELMDEEAYEEYCKNLE